MNMWLRGFTINDIVKGVRIDPSTQHLLNIPFGVTLWTWRKSSWSPSKSYIFVPTLSLLFIIIRITVKGLDHEIELNFLTNVNSSRLVFNIQYGFLKDLLYLPFSQWLSWKILKKYVYWRWKSIERIFILEVSSKLLLNTLILF
jgi:hypothetical protein